MKLDESLNLTRLIKNQSKQLADFFSSLDHTEFNIKSYLARLKKMSLQSVDILNEIERQTGFLKNEILNFENRKKSEESRRRSAEQRRKKS